MAELKQAGSGGEENSDQTCTLIHTFSFTLPLFLASNDYYARVRAHRQIFSRTMTLSPLFSFIVMMGAGVSGYGS